MRFVVNGRCAVFGYLETRVNLSAELNLNNTVGQLTVEQRDHVTLFSTEIFCCTVNCTSCFRKLEPFNLT